MKKSTTYLNEYLGWQNSGPDYQYKYSGSIHPLARFRSLRANRYALLTAYLVPLLIIAIALIIEGSPIVKLVSAAASLVVLFAITKSFRNATATK